MKNFSCFQYTLTVIAIVFTGCVAPQDQVQPTVALSCVVPTITALPGTNGEQGGSLEKGGVVITVVPVTYQAVKKEKVTLRQVAQPFMAAVIMGNQPAQVYVEETTTPYLVTDPARLAFSVRINNKLARVFRGQGAVVQFNVAGKLIPLNLLDYSQFVNGIVPPQNEQEFMIYGPRIDSLADKGTIGINFYDVVTATNVAGAVTERQNFEWIFSYTTHAVEQTAQVVTKAKTMDVGTFQQLMIKQSMQARQEIVNQAATP